MIWDDTNVDRLRALVAEAHPASVIGNELGITRNAVIGKMARIGLKSLNPPHGPRTMTQRPIDIRNRRKGTKPRRHRFRPPVEFDMTDFTPDVAPRKTRKKLLDLAPHDCRWPCGTPGEPDFWFCGAPQVEGFSYCAGHCQVAYRPAQELPSSDRALARMTGERRA